MNSKADRRISQRVPAQFRVDYIHEGDYLISHSRDISIDGMFLYTNNPPMPPEKTTLSFSLNELQNVTIEAEVVWANQAESPKDAGMAVKFISPSPQLQEVIMKMVNKVAVLTD